MEITKQDYLRLVGTIVAGVLSNPANSQSANTSYDITVLTENTLHGAKKALELQGIMIADDD